MDGSSAAGAPAEDGEPSALAIIDRLRGAFRARIAADLQRLDALARAYEPGEPDAARPGLYRIAHDIKGQGTTFGYDLVSSIAAVLCRLTAAERPSPAPGDAVRKAVRALAVVHGADIRGSGGDRGQALLARLEDGAP